MSETETITSENKDKELNNNNNNNNNPAITEKESKLVQSAVTTMASPTENLFDESKYPGLQETEWQRFFGTLNSKKMKFIAKLAEQNQFKIRMKNDKGDYVVITKTYQDPTTEEWQRLEDLRAEYADMLREDTRVVAKVALWTERSMNNKTDTALTDLTDEEKIHRRKCARFLADIQAEGARIFLGITKEQFLRCDFRSLSDAVDACNHRTQYSIPY